MTIDRATRESPCHHRLVQFATTLFQTGNNTGIEVPPEVLESLGGGKRPAVVVSVNGYRFTSTVGVMGGRALIPFSAEKRRATKLAGGDAIEVMIELDTAPREVLVPEDLATALAEAGVAERFAALSPSARKAHVTAVEGAKAAQTRARRIASAVATLAG
nr:YdeI/OmpD-associated family protein [Rathayibacter rathayi]